MKLLVLAQIPPPLHGQSLMVQTLVEGLPAQGIAVHHVPLNLSRDHADIGRWRLGKVCTVLAACARAVAARFTQGCDTLYYVPAPGKRGALYRDWVVMLLCRPFFRRLILHWHASGLADWLAVRASAPERWLTRRLLGQAALSIVLDESLRADAEVLNARRIAIVPNGIADPGEPSATGGKTQPFQVLFLGLCSEEKGLFACAEAVVGANRAATAPRFVLVAAGSFPDATTRRRFEVLCAAHPSELRHVGPVQGDEKVRLFRTSGCLCLPTRYPAEGQPLVVLEALAHDVPVIASRWRALAATLPPGTPLCEPGDIAGLATALMSVADAPPSSGALRGFFLARYTQERHLAALAAALKSVR